MVLPFDAIEAEERQSLKPQEALDELEYLDDPHTGEAPLKGWWKDPCFAGLGVCAWTLAGPSPYTRFPV